MCSGLLPIPWTPTRANCVSASGQTADARGSPLRGCLGLKAPVVKAEAYVLIGGVAVGTRITLLFVPALYALWFRLGTSRA